MIMYIIIRDDGGKNETCSGMDYHLPESYMIEIDRSQVSNYDIDRLIRQMAKTRKKPRIIAAFESDKILQWDKLKIED